MHAGQRIRDPERAGLSRRACARPLLLCVTLCLMANAGLAQQATEYQVKAAYLYNFAKFVQWPPQGTNDAAFGICVLGRDHFGATLDATVAGENINGRRVEVQRIFSPRESGNCRILYVGSREGNDLRRVLEEVRPGTLTVSDLPDFMDRGGMIQFVLDNNRVRFEVNLDAAERAGLTLSSELLKVAMAVRHNSKGGF